MKAYLNSQGITSGLIDLGGNILALGPKETSGHCLLHHRHPETFRQRRGSHRPIEVTDQSVVTQRESTSAYFESDLVSSTTTFWTATGYLCDNGLASVTIINNSSVTGRS